MNYVHLVHKSLIIINENVVTFELTSFIKLYVNKLRLSFSPQNDKQADKEKKPEDIFEQQHKLMRGACNVNDLVA